MENKSVKSGIPKPPERFDGRTYQETAGSCIPRLRFKSVANSTKKDSIKRNIESTWNAKKTEIRSKSCDEAAFKGNFKIFDTKHTDNSLQERSEIPESKLIVEGNGICCERSKSEHRTSKSSINLETSTTKKNRNFSLSSILYFSTRADSAQKSYARVNVIDNSTKSPELIFYTKKKRFEQMKNELSIKQREVMDAYNSLLDSKRQVEIFTQKPIELDKLRIIVHKDCDNIAPLDDETLMNVEKQIKLIPNALKEILQSCIQKRSKIFEWLDSQSVINKNQNFARQIEIFKHESEKENKMLVECEEQEKTVMEDIIEKWRQMHTWRESVNNKLAKYESEMKLAQEKIKQQRQELDKLRSVKNDFEKKLKYLTTELKKIEVKDGEDSDTEKIQNIQKSQLQLKCTKQRLRDTENRLKISEQKVEQLVDKIKNLEEEFKSKENYYESSTRDIINSSKLNESLRLEMEKEKIATETKVNELQKLLNTKDEEHFNNIQKLTNKLTAAEKALEQLQAERKVIDRKYATTRERLVELEIKNQQNDEMNKGRINAGEMGSAELKTKTEYDLWNDLQTTKLALKVAEEKLSKKVEEKQRFLRTIQNAIAEKDLLSSEGWTARLIQKDEEITNLRQKIDVLSDTIVYSKNLASRQEKKILSLKTTLDHFIAHDRIMGITTSIEGDNEDNNALGTDKERIEKLFKKVKELEDVIIKKDDAIIAGEKKIKEQENLLKVRDGIIGIIKSKKDMTLSQYDQLREYVNDLMRQYNDVNLKLQAKQTEINALQTSLECKIMQVERLEKTIHSLEQLCKTTTAQVTDLQSKIHIYQKTFATAENKIANDNSEFINQ